MVYRSDPEIARATAIATRDAIKAAQRKGLLDPSADLETTAANAVKLGLCSAAEALAWKEAEQARYRAIQVDEHTSLHFSRQEQPGH